MVNAPELGVALRQRGFHLLMLGNVDMADDHAAMVRGQRIDIHQKPPLPPHRPLERILQRHFVESPGQHRFNPFACLLC
jgi:hypothetical protein